jgi:glycosyltransferase involved in cell wall biosynthesis
MINTYQNYFSRENKDSLIRGVIKNDVMDFVFVRATGIRVLSQAIGEMVYDRYPELLKKIYILPSLSKVEELKHSLATVDLHQKFPQFGIILISSNRLIDHQILKRSKIVMAELSKRYTRIKLIMFGRIKHYFWKVLFGSFNSKYILYKERDENMLSYYRTANVFIDVSKFNEPDGALTEVALVGCPIVASLTDASKDLIHDGENGFIIENWNPKLFARKIIEILEKNNLRESMRIFHYSITEIYGNSLEDFHARLIDIWDTCKSASEGVNHIPKPILVVSPAFTLEKIKKVEKKIQKKGKRKYFMPEEGDENSILNVDAMRLGTIKEALAELEAEEGI